VFSLSLRKLEKKVRGLTFQEIRRLNSRLPDAGLGILPHFSDYEKELEPLIRRASRSTVDPFRTGLRVLGGKSAASLENEPLSAGLEKQFVRRFSTDLRPYLGRSWQQALRYIIRINLYEKSSPGTWLRSINGLSELFVWALAKAHNRSADSNSRILLKQRDGKYLKYGQLLDANRPLARAYPGLLDELREINKRRNDDQESHAINEKTGRRPQSIIKAAEVKRLKRLAGIGLQKVVNQMLNIGTTENR
jgi:hypothetical protein